LALFPLGKTDLAVALDFAERLPESRMTRRPTADEPVFAHFSGTRLEGETPLSPRRRSPVLAEAGSEEPPFARSNPARGREKRHLVLVQVLALTLGCFVLVITCGQLRHVGSLAGPKSWKTNTAQQAIEGSDSIPSQDWIEEEMLKPPSQSNSEAEVMKDWYEEEPQPMGPEEGKVIEHAIYTPDSSPVRLAPVGLLVTPMQLPQLFQAGMIPNGRIQGPMLIPVGTGPPVLPAPYCMGTVLPGPGAQDMSMAEEQAPADAEQVPDEPAEETPKLEAEDMEEQVPALVDQVPEAPSVPWGFAGGRWADAESSGNSEAEGSRVPASKDSARQVSASHDAVASAQQEPSQKRAQDAERRKKKKAGRRKKEAPKVPAREAQAKPPAPELQEEEPKRVIRLEELLGLHLKPTDGRRNPGASAPGAAAPAVLPRQTSQDTDTTGPAAHERDAAAGKPIPMTSSQKSRKGRPKKPQAALASAPLPRSGRQWRAGQRHVAAEEG